MYRPRDTRWVYERLVDGVIRIRVFRGDRPLAWHHGHSVEQTHYECLPKVLASLRRLS